jgi:hypothetical protein
MKKTKINIEEVCKCYNDARTQNSGRKGGAEWTFNILRSAGLSGNMARRIMHEPTLLVPIRRENAGKGNYKGYVFPCTPIHISWFQNWLTKKKEETPKISAEKDENFEEECATYLKQQGYKLRKCVGFDEDAFKKDYPQLWSKYLIYENV